MHSVIYRTEVLRRCGIVSAQAPSTWITSSTSPPDVKNMYLLNLDLYPLHRPADQSVNESVMVKRVDNAAAAGHPAT